MTEIKVLGVTGAEAPQREQEQDGWFIPPVVIPAIGVMLILVMATARALAP